MNTEGVLARCPSSSLVWGVALSADGRLAVGQNGPLFRTLGFLWNDEGRRLKMFDDQSGWIRSAVFSPDNRFLLTGAARGTSRQSSGVLVLRDGRSGESLGDLVGHRDSVLSTAMSADGRLALSADRSGFVFAWPLPA